MRGNYGGCGDGWGGNCWWIVILFLALMWGGNGWGNNGFQNAIGYENLATSNEVQRGFDNQNSMANEREILASINNNSMQGVMNANQNTQYITGQIMDKYGELQRDIAGVSMQQQQTMAQQSQCCCETKQLISETASQQRYDSAMQTAQLQQAIQAEGAATRGLIQQNKIEALQQKVAALENGIQTQQLQSDIAAATANTIRWPNQWTYGAGMPPIWNTCNCQGGSFNI
jgi:hypothetical protein